MSRIGKKPVNLESGVTAAVVDGWVVVKGPKGELRQPLHPRIEVSIGEGQVTFARPSDRATDRAAHGLMRSLVAGAVEGVTKGYERTLEINGVGYRAQVEGQKLTLSLGYSHPVVFDVPEGISVELGQKNQLVVKGIDKREVGHIASLIRSLRPPEPYKGKGIKYSDERIRRKVGKTGA